MSEHTIPVESLPSYLDYAKWRDQLYGVGFWGHLGALIRRIVDPGTHKLYLAAYKTAEFKITSEFLDACYQDAQPPTE